MALTWAGIGERVRMARAGARRTQDEVAAVLEVDRFSVGRMESGQRKVSALELARLAEFFEVPMGYFLGEEAPAVVSRRTALSEEADEAARMAWRLDVDLEAHAADVRLLAQEGFLGAPALLLPAAVTCPADLAAAESYAATVRGLMGQSSGPLGPLTEVCERWGLYLLVVDRDADGASTLIEEFPGVGAAVIGGQAPPGRRRATAAHELGHHLLGDAYSSDVGVSIMRSDRERLIDAFACALLLPGADVAGHWAKADPTESDWQWRTLVRVAGSYRVSWSVAVQRARDLGLLDSAEARMLVAHRPVFGDFLAQLGAPPEEDLTLGDTGPNWRRAVLAAYSDSLITGKRAIELLHGAITRLDELPSIPEDDTP
ncbi:MULTISPECIES: ImmA/IrrE family metallo-endopeptidase [unclassified Crossiella]|uniref:helix-turn-helix domain-containing protein n=1 Tax=unclassified Crossiella TaxID=2620835 RepID=UPI001FFEE840|nr:MULTISPECIES: XRE family transcriptional regulator [unclassified Crossiella]MCK2240768.1 XRE family transcriptional regulator [Crossiella sp. S99.2]MCK2254088.1 XRE family transcriptional regulator [Crossiella sp. S99.1]